ncbi:hypothetical protein KC926_01550 [Candidatus Kaiserbacteria bacterium]|nr:hypothetical protein [Candidatus Kaiserbacteria bacterium]
MKNYLAEKKYAFTSLFISALVLAISYTFFKTKCFSSSCGTELLDGWVVPSFWLGLLLVFITSFFLFFPERIFKKWLKKIAWWYAIVLFLLVATTPVHSSNILSLDRSQVVLWGMVILAIITVPFVLLSKREGIGD